MIKAPRKFHFWFALLTILGCAEAPDRVIAQAIYPWPGVKIAVGEEADNFRYQLGTACTAAVRADRLPELKELYKAGGREFNPEDEYARSMLFYAAQESGPELIQWLLADEGGKLASRKFDSIAGRTPLELAAEVGRPPEILKLLREGAPAPLLALATERGFRKGFRSEAMGEVAPQSLVRPAMGWSSLAERPAGKPLTPQERLIFVRLRLALSTKDKKDPFPELAAPDSGLSPEDRRLLAQDVVLLTVESGQMPDERYLAAIGTPDQLQENWVIRGARALSKATMEHDGGLEMLWPLAEKLGWVTPPDFRDLAILSASYRKPANLRYALAPLDEKTVFTLQPGEPPITEVILEQMDLDSLAVLREKFPARPLVAGMTARQVFDRFFWDNVAPPSPAWHPYLEARRQSKAPSLAWEENLAEVSKRRVNFLAATEKLGADLSTYAPDDLGQVLKAVLWLQDEPLYRAMTARATPEQLAYVDEDGWTLLEWESWCGIAGPQR